MILLDRLFLITACISIFLATAMTFGDGVHDFKMAGLCLVFMLLAQILINAYLKTQNIRCLSCSLIADLLIFFFYGTIPLAVCYYLQSREMNLAVIIAGMICGTFALMAYITRDYMLSADLSDQPVQERKVRPTQNLKVQYLYLYSLLLSCLIPVLLYLIMEDHLLILLCSFILFFYGPVIKIIFSSDQVNSQRMITFHIFGFGLYSFIFAIGWIF